ncbi:hypothetical protein VPNG_01418 [Cytospora leucostoma]|uniref:Carrier domain-containing protein n=1 Tax=Cytospora leucostoma TaxID=1230097 RepID=A0A423XKJ3_9PEZI|nr:hypothetical protein VPNG_01418 [Cytospora leucostoma]
MTRTKRKYCGICTTICSWTKISLVQWRESEYGAKFRFTNSSTLASVRHVWAKYAEASAKVDNTQYRADFQAALKHTKDYKTAQISHYGTGSLVYGGARAAAPLGMQAMRAADLSTALDAWWEKGTTGPVPDDTNIPNPLFAVSLSENAVLAYGADPILSYHLATASAHLAELSPLRLNNVGKNPDPPRIVEAARKQFEEWATAFRDLTLGDVVLRFVVADCLSFSQTLQYNIATGETSGSYHRRQLSMEALDLDPVDYGPAGYAPRNFDVIDTSNLSDHLGALNILVSASPLLKHAPWATLYTETMEKGTDGERQKFEELLCGPTRTVSTFLGISPVEYWTNATAASTVDEYMLALTAIRTSSQKPGIQWRFSWKFNQHLSNSTDQVRLEVNADALATLVHRIYQGMFANEDIMSLLSISREEQISILRKQAYPKYHRGSLVALVKRVLQTVDAPVEPTCRAILKKINEDSTRVFGSNFAQSLSLDMSNQGLYTEPWLVSEIRSGPQAPLFATWSEIPESVAVTISVPSSNWNKVAKVALQDKVGFAVEGNLRGFQGDVPMWHNTFGDVQVTFGSITTQGTQGKEDYSVAVEEDKRYWRGDSHMVASFRVPTAALQVDPKHTQVSLCLQYSSQNFAVFNRKLNLGQPMAIMETTLGDKVHVYVTKHLPGQERLPLYNSLESCGLPGSMATDNSSSFKVDLDSSGVITTITGHLDILSAKGKQLLTDKVTVEARKISPFAFEIVFGKREAIYSLHFPVPVVDDGFKTRVARRSSYVEVIAPLADPAVSSTLDDFIFPTALFEATVASGNVPAIPVTLNIPHVNLNTLPIIDVSDKQRLAFLTTLVSWTFSVRERKLRDLADMSGLAASARLNFKESLFTMFMLSSGLQGGQTGLFAINHPERGGIHMLIFISSLRLDGANASVVLDGAVIPFTVEIIKSGKLDSFLLVLRTLECCTITVNDEELVLWKKVLPSLVERCRTWTHRPECEYARPNAVIPLSTEPAEQVLCSCGAGKLPEDFINLPEWDTAAEVSTRLAISPTYAVPFVEEVINPDMAKERPNAAYGLWPVASDSYDAGFHTITYSQLSNIVNGLAWWVVKQLGPAQDVQQKVLTYIGSNDVRLTAMILATVKAGYALFFTSPRNSPAAQHSLFEALKCRTLITSDSKLPSVLPILDVVKPRCLKIPSLDELLQESFPLFAYDKAFETGRWDPLFIMYVLRNWKDQAVCVVLEAYMADSPRHTSGSTGIPKPLVWTQETAARHYASAIQEVPDQQDVTSVEHLISGKRVMVTVPPFHGAGLLQYVVWAIRAGCIPIAPAAVGIVTAHGLVEALKHTPAEVAVLVPSVIADLAQNPDQLSYCADHLKLILYLGGDLPQAIGNVVAARIPLRCWWGASEVGIPHQLIPRGLGPDDWRYIRFHSSVGAAFEEVSDCTYELVIRKDKELPQAAFSIRGQEPLVEYRTKDLFDPHPTVADVWCWRARKDDIIVFLNGEKTNPVSMEQHVVARNPELGGALVFGTQRLQAALLIDPAALSDGPLTTSEQAALIERVWPSVQEANAVAPAHARVERSMILVVDRPLIRAGKGTIQRAASIQQYDAEIESLYANADLALDDENSPGEASLNLTDTEIVTRFIRESVFAVTDWSSSDEAYTTGTFFENGMDSLMALRLLRLLRRALHRPDLGLSTIYSNPTVEQLGAALFAKRDEPLDNEASLIKPLLSTYRALIEQIPKPEDALDNRGPSGIPVSALLTGSTGTVGTFLLRALLDRPGIDRVYCLNRSEDGGYGAQKLRMTDRGLDVADLDDRVTFIHAEFDQPLLGVGGKTYKRLCDHVGIIIHNAWPVNFNLRLSAFQPQLAGLVNLIRLSTTPSSKHPASLIFISSVSAVGTGGPAVGGQPIPEEVPTLSDAPNSNGYARSKFLSELLCESAAQKLGIPVTIARVGQVAGAVRLPGGKWNQKEWFPSLVIGSLSMGCLPDNLGAQFTEIDWLPVDLLANVLVDLVEGQPSEESGRPGSTCVYNLRNPHTTTWESLLPAIIDAARTLLGPDRVPEVVPPSIWLERLDAASKEHGDVLLANPALKLAEFYRNYLWGEEGTQQKIPPMSVGKTYAQSTAFRNLQAITPQWVQKWVGEWVS